MNIEISSAHVRQQATAILERLDSAETDAELRDMAEQAWHQLFGMYRLVGEAEGDTLEALEQAELIRDLLAQALKRIEAIFDEACCDRRPSHPSRPGY